MNWKVIETLGYAYYMNKGYRVLIPLINNSFYDFVAEKENKFIRVNVKAAGLKDKKKPNSWCISRSKQQENMQVDVFLVWLPLKSCFVELDGTFFDAVKSKSRLIPK